MSNKETITITELRKRLKPLGYKVKTKTLSFGVSGSIHRISDDTKLPEIFFSEDDRQKWIGAINVIQNITVIIDSNTRVSGPWSGA